MDVVNRGLNNRNRSVSELASTEGDLTLQHILTRKQDRILNRMSLLEKVARCLRDAKLTINAEKSKFCYREVRYLGYVVGDGCIRTDTSKVAAMKEFPQPKPPEQFRRFLGMTGWYRRFIYNYATIAAPLHDCLAKGKIKKFNMTEEAVTA
ncbi:PREDICTED: uncharacterized mitochondrial protein AtMg00860-like, partial [Rhagoletis zephyria]|uniref:uncharacterized mitochondrial protein AtMg00860-like n=1 Tax=Rhagoletis zephyria TaxID=28612 RepID=UPI0008116EC1